VAEYQKAGIMSGAKKHQTGRAGVSDPPTTNSTDGTKATSTNSDHAFNLNADF